MRSQSQLRNDKYIMICFKLYPNDKYIMIYFKLYPKVVLVPGIGFTQFKSKPSVMNKITSSFKVRKNNHQVIYQTNSVLFQIIMAGCFSVCKSLRFSNSIPDF